MAVVILVETVHAFRVYVLSSTSFGSYHQHHHHQYDLHLHRQTQRSLTQTNYKTLTRTVANTSASAINDPFMTVRHRNNVLYIILFDTLYIFIYTKSFKLLYIDVIKFHFLFGPSVCGCSYLCVCLKGKISQCFDHMGLTELIKCNNFQQQSYF